MCTDPGCESAVAEIHCTVTASYGQLHEINSFNCCSIPHSPFSWLLWGGTGISPFIWMQLERPHANYSQYTTHILSSATWLNGTWYSILNSSASQSVISKMAQTQQRLWNRKTKFNATTTGRGIPFHGSPVAQYAENLQCDKLCLCFLLTKFFVWYPQEIYSLFSRNWGQILII